MIKRSNTSFVKPSYILVPSYLPCKHCHILAVNWSLHYSLAAIVILHLFSMLALLEKNLTSSGQHVNDKVGTSSKISPSLGSAVWKKN